MFNLLKHLFIILLFIQTAGHAQWMAQQSNIKHHLNSVFFIDAKTGLAVGNFGYVLKTTNGGDTWTILAGRDDRYYFDVQFLDPLTGYRVDRYNVDKTTNGGHRWSYNYGGRLSEDWFEDLYFTDAQHGWVVGDAGVLFRTENGGENWQKIDLNMDKWLTAVYFINNEVGWIGGEKGLLLQSIDGGQTWYKIQSGVTGNLYSICFSDSQTGWIVGNGVILKTSDSGDTWQQQEFDGGSLTSIDVISNQFACAVGMGGTIYFCEDGETWTRQTSGTTENLNKVDFVTKDIGYIVGNNGTILKTTDGGLTSITNKKPQNKKPSGFTLASVYPNPFNPETTITYTLDTTEWMNISIYSIRGELVRNLVQNIQTQGNQVIHWDGRDENNRVVPAGLYLCVLTSQSHKKVLKMTLLK